jgi:hypothetical protein
LTTAPFFSFIEGVVMPQSNHISPSQLALEARARRAAQRAGLIARKSRRADPLRNHGGFMLVDLRNCAQAGFQYDLSAKEVIKFCS